MKPRTYLAALLTLAVVLVRCLPLAAAEPQAAPIPADAAVKRTAVTGLHMAFYDFYPKDAAGIDSIDIAKKWIGSHEPNFTYGLNTSSVNFPPEGELSTSPLNITMGQFLLGEAEFKKRQAASKGDAKVLPPRLAEPIGSRTIYVFTGFIKVDKAGTYTVSVPCDDGDETSIGGVVVHARPSFGGINADPDSPENVGRAEFAAPGIYPLKVILYDRDPGALGIHVFSDLDAKGERHANGHVLLPVLRTGK